VSGGRLGVNCGVDCWRTVVSCVDRKHEEDDRHNSKHKKSKKYKHDKVTVKTEYEPPEEESTTSDGARA